MLSCVFKWIVVLIFSRIEIILFCIVIVFCEFVSFCLCVSCLYICVCGVMMCVG